jgi:hypothetical protein
MRAHGQVVLQVPPQHGLGLLRHHPAHGGEGGGVIKEMLAKQPLHALCALEQVHGGGAGGEEVGQAIRHPAHQVVGGGGPGRGSSRCRRDHPMQQPIQLHRQAQDGDNGNGRGSPHLHGVDGMVGGLGVRDGKVDGPLGQLQLVQDV